MPYHVFGSNTPLGWNIATQKFNYIYTNRYGLIEEQITQDHWL